MSCEKPKKNPITLATFILLLSLVASIEETHACDTLPANNGFEHFKTKYQWTHINFTWPSHEAYREAIKHHRYIPKHVMPFGVKFYESRAYITTPRRKPGVPSTLNYIRNDGAKNEVIQNPLLTPFPSWAAQTLPKNSYSDQCSNLVSLFSLEIDQTRGELWGIDGERTSIDTQCPCKLVLIDLHHERITHQHVFDEDVCLKDGGFLNDIVIEDRAFAYISDASNIDPGLVVYSRAEDSSFKIRHQSFQVRPNHEPLNIGKYKQISKLLNVNGIALSPKTKFTERLIYYTKLDDEALYSVNTKFLKRRVNSDDFGKNVVIVGELQGNGVDGLVVDSDDNLYYAIISLNAAGKFVRNGNSSKMEIFDRSTVRSLWNLNLAFDENSYLYLLSFIFKPHFEIVLDGRNNFFISEVYTGSKNYQF